MTYLRLLVTLPLTLFAVLFAVSNRADVTLAFWPWERTWEAPLYVMGLGLLGLGFFTGSLFTWLPAQVARWRHWKTARHAARLEKELQGLRGAQSEKDPALTGQSVISSS